MSLLMLCLILVTVTLSACAQLALKFGVSTPAFQASMDSGGTSVLFAAITSPLIWLGLMIYVVSVAMWLWVLSKVDLSVAYPFVGISFLITLAFGIFLLDEAVSQSRIVGTILITAGCILVGRSA